MSDSPSIRPSGAATTDLFDSQLRELCHALGWQGGTYHQVLAEVKRLKAIERPQ